VRRRRGRQRSARELAAGAHGGALGTGLLGVVAGTAAFTAGEPWLAAAVAAIDANRRLLGELLDEHLPGARCRPPDAGYLAWVDLREAGPDGTGLGDDPARAMLARGRVAVSAGPTFGTGGAGHVRLTLATSPELLAETVRRMALALP
jgi:cystathionine beta-lyase